MTDEPTRRLEDAGDEEPTVAVRPDATETPPPTPPPRSRRGFSDRDLPVAIAAGVLLVATLIGTLLAHPAAFTALVTVLVLVGVVETGRVWRESGAPVAVPVVLVAALVMLLGSYRVGSTGQAVGVVTLLIAALVWLLADPERTEVVRTAGNTVLLGLWVPFLGSFAVLLAVRETDGWVAVLATTGVAIVSDIGAYVVGMRYGRRKLAPSVSPGKTWEGVAGGLVVAVVAAVIILPLLGSGGLFSPLSAVVFALVVAAAGVVGDLVESLLKRDLGVKDFGGVIPGHGGILDRVDALLFALPTGYYALVLLGR